LDARELFLPFARAFIRITTITLTTNTIIFTITTMITITIITTITIMYD
jgi:hypothetical protein